jgi:hypothetical protein
MMTTNTETDSCEIYIRHDDQAWQIVRELGTALGVDRAAQGKLWMTHEGWQLSVTDNQAGDGPWYYYERGLKPDYYFNYFWLVERSAGTSTTSSELIESILRFYWSRSIPAAVGSFACAQQRPLMGGNELEKMFWAAEQFPDGKIPPVIEGR